MACTPDQIKEEGFTESMFSSVDASFEDWLQKRIDKQATLLKGRIGETAFASADVSMKGLVDQAHFCLVAADLVRVRITTLMDAAIPEGELDPTEGLRKQRKDYTAEAEDLIRKIAAQRTRDAQAYGGGLVIS
jgi:hypothetical protein